MNTGVHSVCYRAMERQGRLRIPCDLLSGIPWVPSKGDKVQVCRGWLGTHQQLQIGPTQNVASATGELFTALGINPARASEANSAWVDLARYSATAWNIRFSYEPGSSKTGSSDRLTITLPKELQTLKILPPVGSMVAAFWVGEIFELWDASKWLARAAEFARKQDASVNEALTAVQERISD